MNNMGTTACNCYLGGGLYRSGASMGFCQWVGVGREVNVVQFGGVFGESLGCYRR